MGLGHFFHCFGSDIVFDAFLIPGTIEARMLMGSCCGGWFGTFCPFYRHHSTKCSAYVRIGLSALRLKAQTIDCIRHRTVLAMA